MNVLHYIGLVFIMRAFLIDFDRQKWVDRGWERKAGTGIDTYKEPGAERRRAIDEEFLFSSRNIQYIKAYYRIFVTNNTYLISSDHLRNFNNQ